MSSRKIIFLDIDGVLATFSCWASDKSTWFYDPEHTPEIVGSGRYYPFDQDCVKEFNRLIAETGAQIVISSSWRMFGAEAMRRILKWNKTDGEILECIEKEGFGPRWKEINRWLEKQPDKDTIRFVILDDIPDMGELSDHHVHQLEGELTAEHVDRAIQLLGKK